MDDFVRGGFAQPVTPTTDTGWREYGPAGRLFLPAGTNYFTNPLMVDSNANGQPDSYVFAGGPAGTPVCTCANGVARIQYTGVAGDTSASLIYYIDNVPIIAGEAATIQAVAFGSVVGCTASLQVLTSPGWVVAAQTGAISLTSTPTKFSATGTCAVGAAYSRAYLRVDFISEGGTIDISWSQPMLEKSSILTPYFNGSTHDCSWSGTANASTSVRVVSSLIYTDLVTLNSGGVTPAGTNVAYARNASATNYGPVLVTPTAKSAGDQTAIANLWYDPVALFRTSLVAVGDTLIPLNGDSRAYTKA